MAVVDADYATTLNLLRDHLAHGTKAGPTTITKSIAVIKDAIDRFSASNTATTAVRAAIVVLDATACAASSGATAAAVIVTQSAAIVTAQISVPTYTVSPGLDG